MDRNNMNNFNDHACEDAHVSAPFRCYAGALPRASVHASRVDSRLIHDFLERITVRMRMKRLLKAVVFLSLFLSTAQAQVSLNVDQLGYINTPGIATNVAVEGDIAYVADGTMGVVIFDVSVPAAPSELATLSMLGTVEDVVVQGNLLVVSSLIEGLVFYEVTDPAAPVELGTVALADAATALAIDSNYLYVTEGTQGLHVYDISDPSDPTLVASPASLYDSRAILIEGTNAFLADGSSGVFAYDVTDPTNPIRTGAYNPAGQRTVSTVGADNGQLGFTDDYGVFYLLDARDPSQLLLQSIIQLPTVQTADLDMANEHAYIACDGGGLQIVSLTDWGFLEIVGYFIESPLQARGVDLENGLIYVAGSSGLYILTFSDPNGAPQLGYDYHFVEDYDQEQPNGRPDPGETVGLTIGLRNPSESMVAVEPTAVLTCDDDRIELIDDRAVWRDIAPGFTEINEDDYLIYRIPEDYPSGAVMFTLTLVYNEQVRIEIEIPEYIGPPPVALVNDHDEGIDVSDTWERILSEATLHAEILTSEQALESGLAGYSTVIWATSDDSLEVLTNEEQELISMFLNGGGNLLLTSSNAGEDVGNSSWFAETFRVSHYLDTVESPYILGVSGGPFEGVSCSLVGLGGAGNSHSPSSLQTLSGSTRLFRYSSNGSNAGVAYGGNGHATAYLGFALEAVTGIEETATASELLVSILQYMNSLNEVAVEDEAVALPVQLSLNAWPNPFNASLQIGYSLPAAGDVRVEVFDLLGRQVALLKQDRLPAGHGLVSWDATSAASGTYLVRLSSPQGETVRRVQLVK